MKKIKRLSDDSFFFENGNPKRTATVYVSDLDELEQQMAELINASLVILRGGLSVEEIYPAFKKLQDVVCNSLGKTWEQIKVEVKQKNDING